MLDNEEIIEDSDYIRYKRGKDNYKVALTHASLNNKPIREVHGGCTPEEILVPFIIISNKKSESTNIKKEVAQTQTFLKSTPSTKGFEEDDLF